MHERPPKSLVRFTVVLLITWAGFFQTLASAGTVRGQVDFQGETLHFEFDGQTTWDYQVKRKFNAKNNLYFEMTVPALTAQSLKDYQRTKNALVSKIEIDPQSPSDKTILRVYPANEKVDFFDYLTDQPSKLVVDLYINDEGSEPTKISTPAPKKAKTADGVVVPANKKAVKNDKAVKAGTRAPATADSLTISPFGTIGAAPKAGLFDGSDPFYERFNIKDYEVKDEAIIRSKNNYYIPFPFMEVVTSNWDQVKSRQDSYQIEPKEGKENKDARLLSRIFEKKEHQLFLKTYKYFEKEYPESSYLEALSFMKGDVLLDLWREDTYRKKIGDKEEPKPNADKWFVESIDAYRDALRKYPNSPLAERVSLKVGILLYEQPDYFGALRAFNEHINNKAFGDAKMSLSKNMARVAQGQAFMNIGKASDAVEVYNQLEKESGLEPIRAEAAFRRADVAFKTGKYAESMTEYQKALKDYSKYEKDFPEAVYHQGEAHFWLGNYRDSLNAYREFIRKFPTHSDTPFATTRVGELLEILGADPTRVMGAFLETFFRFGDSPKTIIARIRMTSQKMMSLRDKDAEAAATQILELSTKLALPRIDQFATVMISEGYSKRKDYQKAVDLLVKYYQTNPSTVDKDIFQRRIVANINEKLQGEIDKNQFIDALKTHQRYADTWLKSSPRLDTIYNVGRAFEQAGVPVESEKYYKKVLNDLYALIGTPKEKETSVLEKLPKDQEVLLRLSQVTYREREFNRSLEYIRQIKAPGKMTEDQQIERVDLISQLLEKKGDDETAILHLQELIKTWTGQPAKVAGPYLRMAEAERKLGRETQALRSLQRVDEIQKDSSLVKPTIHSAALKMTADIYLKAEKHDEAIDAMESLLKNYGKDSAFASYRYRLGKLYFDKGDLQKAKTAWGDIDAKDKFWAGLAQEQMNSQKWNDEYKRYLQRIPATAGQVR